MTLRWEGEEDDAAAARRAAAEHAELISHAVGEPISVGNEFADVRVLRVETRNGSRLLIESPKSGQWIALCPLELEALTWQTHETFSEFLYCYWIENEIFFRTKEALLAGELRRYAEHYTGRQPRAIT